MSRYLILPANKPTATHSSIDGKTFYRVIDTLGKLVQGGASRLQESIGSLVELPKPAPAARELSKLTLRRRLRDLGKEDLFDSTLDSIPHARADWDDARVIRTDDPLFTTNANAFKAALGLTNEQFTALLAP